MKIFKSVIAGFLACAILILTTSCDVLQATITISPPSPPPMSETMNEKSGHKGTELVETSKKINLLTEPETEPATEPEIEPETEPSTEPATKPETELETEPATEPESAPVTEPVTETEAELETEPVTESETALETEPVTETEAELETEPVTESETRLETEPDTEPVTEPETEPEAEPDTEPEAEPDTESESEPDEPVQISPETFITELIWDDLEYQGYNVFLGKVTADNTSVTGITFVDYSEGYIDENGRTYFCAGFLALPNEPAIGREGIEGVEIFSLEEEASDEFSYVLTYQPEDVRKHCVIDGQYVCYGFMNGAMYVTSELFFEGMASVDDSLGDLFSFDRDEFIYVIEEHNYTPVCGISILGEADYADILTEVNHILDKQTANLTYAEIQSYVTRSQEALISYLLGLQEETFLDVPTAQLVDIARQLKPMQHLRIGVDESGHTTVHLIEVTKLPSKWEKIMTTIVCSTAIVGGIALGVVSPAITGALIGGSLEVFSQVVLQDAPVTDIQWARFGVGVVSGALGASVSAGITGIAAHGVGQILVRETADLLCDALIGGGEFFVNSLIAGSSFEEACEQFGYGVVAGTVVGAAFKVGTVAIRGTAKLVARKAIVNTVDSINGVSVRALGREAGESALSELQERVLRHATIEGAEDALENNLPRATKPLKASMDRPNRAMREEDLLMGDQIRQQIVSSKPKVSKHVVKADSNHLNFRRTPRSDTPFDSAFINCRTRKQLARAIAQDFEESQLYLRERVYYESGSAFRYYKKGQVSGTRYGFLVEDSKHLSGVLLSDPTTTTANYRVIVDVFDDGTVYIYDAYPEFKLVGDFVHE